jgi:ribosomal protein S18 acetylase RimI-like enzyme
VTLIREYNPATDAAGLAAHFVRSGYGPHHGLSKLGAESMAAVLTERAPELFMVAVDDDDIIGCIGFMRGSGRRVTRDGELFAGLFVLDPRHRNSMLAGNLFVKSFEKLVAGGTRAMRIEANPTNKKAFPLYLRVGFRARPDARADEDGYVELVSHLPGVIGDLLRSNAGDELIDVLPKFSWRNAGAGRDATPTSGVSIQADGAAVVSYDLSAGDFKLRADINMDSGATLGYDVVAGTIQELQLHEGLDRHEPAEVAAVRDLGQGITAEVDALGSVRDLRPGRSRAGAGGSLASGPRGNSERLASPGRPEGPHRSPWRRLAHDGHRRNGNHNQGNPVCRRPAVRDFCPGHRRRGS